MRHRHHHQHHHRVRWIIRSSTTTCGTGTSPGGRSWHHYHNGGPGPTIPSSSATTSCAPSASRSSPTHLRQTKLKQNASPGGRSWHHYHNGGPGPTSPSSSATTSCAPSASRSTPSRATTHWSPFRAALALAHRSHPSPGGRSWHVYHNGGPGLSYPLSLVVVDHTASSIRTTHKAASGFIYPFERGLIFVHAQRAIEACSVWFAHTRVYPTLRAIVAQYYMLYTICYSSLTDSANTTSNIAIPYASSLS